MKKQHGIKKVLKGAVAASITGLLLCGMLFSLPQKTEALESKTSSTLSETNGTYVLKLAGIKDPKQISNENGTYYQPQSYLYFGEIYNSSTRKYDPILWRVLDADADNTGKSGAIFLLSEQVLSTSNVYFSQTADQNILENYLNNVVGGGRFANSYYGSHLQQQTQSLTYFRDTYFNNLKDELNVIRPITKVDDVNNIGGGFGFKTDTENWWTDAVRFTGKDALLTNAEILSGDLLFPLSVEELEKYVADYSGAPGLRAVDLTNSDSAWWLRTAYNDSYHSQVSIVTASGAVNRATAYTMAAGTRYGMNLETDRVTYSYRAGENTWRLALLADPYVNTQTPFQAWVEDVTATGEITLGYTNAIGAHYSQGKANDDDFEYISVMVTDRDGTVKYYGSVDRPMHYSKDTEAPDTYDPNKIITTVNGSVTFKLPTSFNQSAGDKILVFWERRDDDGRKTSLTSNFSELDCIHEYNTPADCVTKKVCIHCKQPFGEFDPNNHAGLSAWILENHQHYRTCSSCEGGDLLKIDFGSCDTISNCTNNIRPCTVCGNTELAPDTHSYTNGVCAYTSTHYEPALTDENGSYLLTNAGNLWWFAEQVNSGHTEYNAILTQNIDLQSNGSHIVIGTEANPYGGTFDGAGMMITNLYYGAAEGTNLGLFGVTDGATVKNLTLRNADVSGKSEIGLLIGTARNTAVENCLIDGTLALSAAEGNQGAVAGITDEKTTIQSCVVCGSTADLPLIGDTNATVTNSYYLAAAADESLPAAKTAEQFASGEVAYLLGEGWGQNLDNGETVQTYPVPGGAAVYDLTSCDENDTTIYYSNTEGDLLAHTYLTLVEFIWDEEAFFPTFYAKTSCIICGTLNPELLECEVTPIYNPPATTYVGTITLGGETYSTNDTGDSVTVYAYTMKDKTVIENVVMDFTGQGISASAFMTNTELSQSVYRAYLRPNEEGIDTYLFDSAWRVGSYDLVLVGDSNSGFRGCVEVYEDALIINPTELPLNITIPDKTYDGTTEFSFEYGVDAELSEMITNWLQVSLTAPASPDVGEYQLTPSISYRTYRDWEQYDLLNESNGINNGDWYHFDKYEAYQEGITLVVPETVTLKILPRRFVNIANVSYADEYTYNGQPLPTPTAENFTADEGSVLTFEWRIAKDVDSYSYEVGRALPGAPTNAGTYFLRVTASATGALVQTQEDFLITIVPKELTVTLDGTEGYETKFDEYYDQPIYVLKPGERVEYTINGLIEGETFQGTVGYSVLMAEDTYYTAKDEQLDSSGYPVVPREEGYYYSVEYSLFCEDPNYSTTNARDSILVEIRVPEVPCIPDMIYSYDGETKDPKIIGPDGWEENYTMTITKDDQPVTEIKLPGRYTITLRPKTALLSTDTEDIVGTVLVQQDLFILIKEMTVLHSELENGVIPFEISQIAYVPGYSPLIGHQLTNLVYRSSETDGDISVQSWTVMDLSDPNNPVDVTELYRVVNQSGIIATLTLDVWAAKYASANYFTLHVFDNVCDSECNDWGCPETRVAEPHSGGTATCTTLASCEVCGAEYGKVNLENHTGNKTLYAIHQYDATLHQLVYACCGTVILTEEHSGGTATCLDPAVCELCDHSYGEKDPDHHTTEAVYYESVNAEKHNVFHTCCDALKETVSHSGGTATCKTLAVCEYCGTSYGTPDSDNHESTEASYAVNAANGNRHDKRYACCGKTVTESHSGGVANCVSGALCTHCGTEYGAKDPAVHSSAEFVYLPNTGDRTKHLKQYACCGATVATEAHSGGTGTCISGAICEHCKEEYGEKNPTVHGSTTFTYQVSVTDATKHDQFYACCGVPAATEDHIGGTATCRSPAICQYCGTAYGAAPEHVYDHACDTICNVCLQKTRAMSFHADTNGDRICDVCDSTIDYLPADNSSNTGNGTDNGDGDGTGTDNGTGDGDETGDGNGNVGNDSSDEGGLSGGAISGIATGSTVVVGAGGFSLFWFVIKKKKWIDLIRLLIG